MYQCLQRVMLAGTILLGGCMVGPDYVPPTVALKPAYDELAPTTAATLGAATQPGQPTGTSTDNAAWWRTFNDSELNTLIEQAESANYDVQIATARVLESRAQRNIAAADLFPDLNAAAAYNHSRGSKNVVIPPLGAGAPGGGGASGSGAGASGGASSSAHSAASATDPPASAADPPARPAAPPLTPLGEGGLPGVSTDLFQTGFDASWELDVFGGTRRSVQAANASLAAAIEDRQDVQLSLLAEVVRDYLTLRGAQRRLAVAQENLAAEREILAVTQSARQSGLVTELDVTRAAGEVSSTLAGIPPLQAQIRVSIHALSVLLARDPAALADELQAPAALPAVPATVPVGVPSELLRRRPDIRAAERRLAASSAQVGTAIADLFPKFSLTATTGLDASEITDLFDWQSHYFLVNPSVTWPIFDAGRIVSNISLRKAGQQEALLQYRKAVLSALRDVEDALVNFASEKERHAALTDAVRQAQQSVDIARQQYRQGLVDFLSVLDAQRTLLQEEDLLAQSDQAVLTNLVALYKSLGGGWGS